MHATVLLCCAVLYPDVLGMLCCFVLCHAVLCFAVRPYHAVQCCISFMWQEVDVMLAAQQSS